MKRLGRACPGNPKGCWLSLISICLFKPRLCKRMIPSISSCKLKEKHQKNSEAKQMASSCTHLDDLNLELSLAPPNAQTRAPPTPVFPNSSYHHGTASNFAEAIPICAEARPNRAVLLGGMIGSKLTPADHWHIAHRSDKEAVDESHTYTALQAVSATNLGLRLLARTRECGALSEEVASLKAMVADLQKRLYCANQYVEELQRKNEDHVELLQILQVRANRGN